MTNVPQQLLPYIEEKKARRVETRDTLLYTLLESSQPLTILEIRELLRQQTGTVYDTAYVKKLVSDLIESGDVTARRETEAERKFRAGGRKPRGVPGMYFWAPAGEVPARTEVTVADGLLLDSTNRHAGGKRSKKRRKTRAKTSGLVGKPKVQTDEISAMIEGLVSQRTLELQARIAELEKVLTGIKKATKDV